MVGDDLRDFVNQKLFPYLSGFTQRATGPDTIEYKIGQIFGEIKNKIQSGYNLREIIDHIDELRFRSSLEPDRISNGDIKHSGVFRVLLYCRAYQFEVQPIPRLSAIHSVCIG